MTTDPSRPARVSRESRLLFLTIGVAAVVLLALARLRFPEPPAVDTATPPLERLAARASYDALAADIERVRALIGPNLVVLRLASPSDPVPRRLEDLVGRSAAPAANGHVVALRIDAGTALAAIDPGARIAGIVGPDVPSDTAHVVAVDSLRRLARLRVPEAPARPLAILALSALRTPAYVVAVEGTQAGVTVRPVFLGHGDRFGAARWSRPVLPLGGVAVAPGALLFSLAGEFLGCVVSEDGGLAVAGARDVLEAVEQLGPGPSSMPATAGVALQTMTPSLARATGAPQGVVVAEVDPRGPAAAVLQPADVITSVDGRPADTADRVLLDLASRPVGAAVSVAIVRMGEPLTVSLTLAAAEAEVARGADSLLPGDVVVRAGNLSDPTPAQLRRLLAQPGGPALVTVVVRRQGRQQVLAVPAAGSNEDRR